MLSRPLHPRVRQLGKILQGIFHLPISSDPLCLAYTVLDAFALVETPITDIAFVSAA
jgi:hypothetical protein